MKIHVESTVDVLFLPKKLVCRTLLLFECFNFGLFAKRFSSLALAREILLFDNREEKAFILGI